MMTPGEEAALILLIAATVLLFSFSILSTVSEVQQEAAQKSRFLRADKIADLVRGGTTPEEAIFYNASIQTGGKQYGGEEPQNYFEARRTRFLNGRPAQIRVRAW